MKVTGFVLCEGYEFFVLCEVTLLLLLLFSVWASGAIVPCCGVYLFGCCHVACLFIYSSFPRATFCTLLFTQWPLLLFTLWYQMTNLPVLTYLC